VVATITVITEEQLVLDKARGRRGCNDLGTLVRPVGGGGIGKRLLRTLLLLPRGARGR
jgi:hypothetical protein